MTIFSKTDEDCFAENSAEQSPQLGKLKQEFEKVSKVSCERDKSESKVNAKRTQVAQINTKLAALDDEQLILQENLVTSAQEDRLKIKKEFEDEVVDLCKVISSLQIGERD